MELDLILKAVAQLGFPIFVAVYLLVRFDSLIRALQAQESAELALLQRIVEAAEKPK